VCFSDAVAKRKIPSHARKSNPRRSARSLVTLLPEQSRLSELISNIEILAEKHAE